MRLDKRDLFTASLVVVSTVVVFALWQRETLDPAIVSQQITHVEPQNKQTEPSLYPRTQPQITEGKDYTVVYDSTARLPMKFVEDPLTDAALRSKTDRYDIHVADVPECSGSYIVNSFVVQLVNQSPYNYATIYIRHDSEDSSVTKKVAEIKKDNCGYFLRTPENQPAIDAAIAAYRSAYEENDLDQIKEIRKTL